MGETKDRRLENWCEGVSGIDIPETRNKRLGDEDTRDEGQELET